MSLKTLIYNKHHLKEFVFEYLPERTFKQTLLSDTTN